MTSTNGTNGISKTNGTKKTYSFDTFYNIIGSELRTSPKFAKGINPSTGEELWDVPIATEKDLDDAVRFGKGAFEKWKNTTWEERQGVLRRLRGELLKWKEELARLVMIEGGKPAQFSYGEIGGAAATLEYYTTAPSPGTQVIQDDPSLKLTIEYFPLGVVAGICPWNFPLILSISKISSAILTGNVIIIKPSPFTPYSTLKLLEILQPLLPIGVVQCLNGDEKMGPWMTEHAGIAKVSFTGSIATGKRVMVSCAKTLKRVTLELGGNSACIVCGDVDVKKVAPVIAFGAFYNSGQLCVASKRLYVHESIYRELLDAIVEVVKSWKVGGAEEEGCVLGPVQNKMQFGIVKGHVEECVKEGYKFAVGGEVEMGDGKGFLVRPTIVENPPTESRIVKEEPFGPIVPIMPWSDEEEVLKRVNDTNTGLGGTVWSADFEQANRIARKIESGTIWINSFERPLPQAFMAGHKESGVGGEYGKEGLLAYMNPQVIHLYKSDVAKTVA